MTKRRRAIAGAIAAVTVALAGCARADADGSHATDAPLAGAQTQAPAIAGAQAVEALFAGIPQHGSSLGEPNAPVVLTEFADLQCPFCAEFAVRTLPSLVREYVREGRVRLVFRPLAFLGPGSVNGAHMAAAAALQNRMFPFVELFFANQGQESSGYVTDAFLRALAEATPGLDVPRAFAERESQEVARQLEQARDEARAFGIHATPSFLLGRAGETPRPFAPESFDPASFGRAIDRLSPAN